jgi:hypothetical protein
MAISAGALQAIVERVILPLSPGPQAEVLEKHAKAMQDADTKLMRPLNPKAQAAFVDALGQREYNGQNMPLAQSIKGARSPAVRESSTKAESAIAEAKALELLARDKEITVRALSAKEAESPTISRLLIKAGGTIQETHAREITNERQSSESNAAVYHYITRLDREHSLSQSSTCH